MTAAELQALDAGLALLEEAARDAQQSSFRSPGQFAAALESERHKEALWSELWAPAPSALCAICGAMSYLPRPVWPLDGPNAGATDHLCNGCGAVTQEIRLIDRDQAQHRPDRLHALYPFNARALALEVRR